MTTPPPIPANEMDRIIKLSDFDLDYAEMQESFKDLTKLAAKVAGTEISLINLIDTFTQWTISNYGLPLEQMPREDSVCQYTIVSKDFFEVEDLSDDDRFKDKFYVVEPPKLRYYFGVPLQTEDGYSIGALCVLDKIGKEITPEKIELLKIIADEIVNRFNALRVIQGLRNKVKEANETKKRVAHDIRGPLGGIINLAQLISEQGDTNKMEEVLMFISMIQKSGSSLLDLADEILSMEKKVDTHAGKPSDNQLNLLSLKDKLEKLYAPQALNKKINFSVTTSVQTEHKPFLKNKLLQIIGNLISNAIKFTPQDGTVSVNLNLETGNDKNLLLINVSDTGVGLDEEAKQYILSGSASSTQGTNDEQGYGFGLALVKHLVTGLNGTMDIQSTPGEGATFTIAIPQNRL
jgi:signal transduction histidine kinase